jgi:murein DD-endopeptidase MepM/ murein hydrolase activator NlpD
VPAPEAPAVQPIARATERERSTYEIKRNDTLLTIAQQVGTTPEELAFENGMTPEAAIYIGQKLILPEAPARISYSDEGIPMIDVAEVASSSEASDIGGPSVPTIDADTAAKVMGREPIQQASIPVRRVTSFSDPVADVRDELARDTVAAMGDAPSTKFAWPVHGEVYRLDAGQVEIDADGEADVSASAAGKVVHVERGPVGVLVVIEHDNGWRSLTVGLDYSEVRPGETVEQGTMIGKASRDHRVRFELRDAEAGVADALTQLRG